MRGVGEGVTGGGVGGVGEGVTGGGGGQSLVDQRSGVFDGDEFDVFRSGGVDLSRVHVGKK